MAIQYSGATIVNTTYTTGSDGNGDFITNFTAALVSAAWTKTLISPSAILTFSGQPSDGDTITLDSSPNNKTYTFKNSVSTTANQVLIDSTAANSIQNLLNAISGGPGSGTKYGSATTPHVTMVASASTATTLTVSYQIHGPSGNGAPVSKSGTNLSWSATTLTGGFIQLTSAITPQGLAMRVTLGQSSGGFYSNSIPTVQFGNRDDSRIELLSASQIGSAGIPAHTQFQVIASKYQFFHFAVGSRSCSTAGYWITGGVPYIPSFMVAPQISSATNASPIQCTLANHGFSSSDTVLIVGGLGNTAINGSWTITKIDANTFSLTGSTGNGNYVPNTAYASDVTIGNTICEAIWGEHTVSGGSCGCIGNGNSLTGTTQWTSVNGNVLNQNCSTAKLQLFYPVSNSNNPAAIQWYNNNFVVTEPIIGWGISDGAISKINGQLWDSALIRKDVNLEQTATFPDTHTYMAVAIDTPTKSALFVMTA